MHCHALAAIGGKDPVVSEMPGIPLDRPRGADIDLHEVRASGRRPRRSTVQSAGVRFDVAGGDCPRLVVWLRCRARLSVNGSRAASGRKTSCGRCRVDSPSGGA
jgi:hypothetical protein